MTPTERTPWQRWPRSTDRGAGKPPASGPGSRRPFGATWWGKAWLDALEQQAQLDPNRLGRGRSYARRGSVLELTVDPGTVRAQVQGSRPTPYEVSVTIRAFSDAEWDAVLDVVAAQVGRVAALLDGELPPEVVDDAQAAGLDLLPGAARCGPRATARTTPYRASTRLPSAAWWRMRSTRTRSRCSCSAAGTVPPCWRLCAPGGGNPRRRPSSSGRSTGSSPRPRSPGRPRRSRRHRCHRGRCPSRVFRRRSWCSTRRGPPASTPLSWPRWRPTPYAGPGSSPPVTATGASA